MTAKKLPTDDRRDQIAHTREELGDTVAALAAKADVKQQVRRRAKRAGTAWSGRAAKVRARAKAFTAGARETAASEPAKSRRTIAAGGAILASGVVAVAGWRRHRTRLAVQRNRPFWAKAGNRLRGSARVGQKEARKEARKRFGRAKRLRPRRRSIPFRRR